MRKVSKKTRMWVPAVSLVSAVVLIVVLLLLWPDQVAVFVNEIFLAVLLIIAIPWAIVEHFHSRWMNAIEDQMPVLVGGISEIQETGLTFIKAFERVVTDKMIKSPLSEEVKKLIVHMSWGLSFEEALKKFKIRLESSVVNRFCALVLEANRSGGQVRKVFTATAGFMQETREMDRETTSQMRPYIVIIFAAFFVFLFTSIILVSSFFVPLAGLGELVSPTSAVSASSANDFFYRTMIIAAFMGGLMAGKIGERRVLGGLKYAAASAIIGYVIFFVTIPPNWMVA
ncbi:type II secretion system F family protein [Candidatus Bathyarchaeota archaeon]|nr:type II secretion system F family protein [Candidatus Bathyarchaeota archaeon]